MYKVIIVISALLSLTILWSVLYYTLLRSKYSQLRAIQAEVQDLYLKVNDALPYFIEKVKQYGSKSALACHGLMVVNVALREATDNAKKYEQYRKLRALLEDIYGEVGTVLRRESEALESMTILNRLDDEIHTQLVKYNTVCEHLSRDFSKFPGNWLGKMGKFDTIHAINEIEL